MNETSSNVVSLGMADSIQAVEQLLNYTFKNKKLLEDALTHPSYSDADSYQRLEFIGDKVLGLAVTSFIFLAYPNVDPKELSKVLDANISNEKFARVAVKHKLYLCVRHNAVNLDWKVTDFIKAVQNEGGKRVYGGVCKAPKVLADIVESVAGAVYVDCKFDTPKLWDVFRGLLEPITTLDVLNQQPQPVSMLFKMCQQNGMHVDIKHRRKGEKNIASVYMDDQLVTSISSDQNDISRLHAAEAALNKLAAQPATIMTLKGQIGVKGGYELEGAKQMLNQLCEKKRWPKPSYRVNKADGPAYKRMFACSVLIDGIRFVSGEQKFKLRDAENSAASLMVYCLEEAKLPSMKFCNYIFYCLML